MDAISFVLGESTKNLRVKKLSVRKNRISVFLFKSANVNVKFTEYLRENTEFATESLNNNVRPLTINICVK